MPVSYGENRVSYKQWLKDKQPETFLDIGMGYGELGKIAKTVLPDIELTGVEIFLPYLVHERSNVKLYKTVVLGDMRELIGKLWAHDVIIAFDVIEHMHREDGLAVIDYLRALANFGLLVSVPIKLYPQGAVNGNAAEEHLDQWSVQEMQAIGGVPVHIGEVVGTFEFKRGI